VDLKMRLILHQANSKWMDQLP